MESDVTDSIGFYKFWAWLDTNRKQVTYGITIVVGVTLIVWFFVWRSSEKEIAASEALSSLALPMLTGAGKTEGTDGYLKLVAEYPNSAAAARALLQAAGAAFAEGKYPEAKGLFERFRGQYRDSAYIGEALLGIAACFDAQGQTNEAMTAYRDLVDHHPGETVIPQAKFALARLSEAQNKPEQAKTYFEEVARNDPYGSLGSEAGMRLEELKIKYPQLTPVVPAATNPPQFRIEKK
jgi:TolA-binding protein